MPLYNYGCTYCGYYEEYLMSFEKSQSCEVMCNRCSLQMIKLVSMPAKTATLWNGGWNAGLSSTGFYSPSVGAKVSSKREEAMIMEKKGFVPESDLPKFWWEDQSEKQAEKYKAQEALTEKYKSILAETGDKEAAVSQTFTAESCLDGTLDAIYNDKISI